MDITAAGFNHFMLYAESVLIEILCYFTACGKECYDLMLVGAHATTFIEFQVCEFTDLVRAF